MNGVGGQKSSMIMPVFVETIPADASRLDAGKLYISMKYKTLVHRCPCGCGGLSEIGLHPATRRMIYDGETVSIMPSVGVPTLACRSHYWISRNRIVWADRLGAETDARLDRYRNDLTKAYVQQQENDEISFWARLRRKARSCFGK